MVKIKLLLGYALLHGGGVALQAQDKMYLNLGNSAQQVYDLKDLKSLTFPAGKVAINKVNGTSDVQAIVAIKNIRFEITDPLSTLNELIRDNAALSFYPNPIHSEALSIRYELAVAQPVTIELLNTSGRVERRFLVEGMSGNNESLCELQDLKAGVYLCRVSTGDQVQTGKVIKH